MFRHFSRVRLVTVSTLLVSTLALAVSGSQVHATDGHTDTSFGTSGVASVSIAPSGDTTSDVAVQSDGKIIVAGTGNFSGGVSDFVLTRFNADGTLDSGFGVNGIVRTDFTSNSVDELTSITLQSDGKILATGSSSVGGVTYASIARYKIDGSLDPDFDLDGRIFVVAHTPAVEAQGTEIFTQPDGKIVVVGQSIFDANTLTYQPFVIRLLPDGTNDFIKAINTAESAAAYTGTLQADGKIVLVGRYGSNSDKLGIWRVDTNGNLDTNFGVAGAVISSHMSYATAVAVQADGKILIGGAITTAGSWYNSAIHRYTTDGDLDLTFSGDGIFETSFSERNDNANDLVVRNDGSVVIVGQAFVTNKDLSFVAQVTPNGVLDTRYSNDGFQIITVGTGASAGVAAALDSDAKLLMATSASFGSNVDLAVLRLNPPSTTSSLTGLSVTGASLSQSFSSSTTSYTAAVAHTTSSVTITPTTTHANATVTVNGSAVTSGTASASLSLAVGANVIPVVVTAQDGATRTTYTITVTRAAAPVVDSSSGNSSGGTTGTTLPPSTTSTSPSPTTTSPSAPPTTTVAATAVQLTVKLKKSLTAKALLASRSVKLASTSKVVVTVRVSSQKFCSVNGTRVTGVKKGSCTVVVAVTPKTTKTVKKPKTTKTTITVRVV